MQVRYGEMWICVREGEDVCMWFAAKWIFAGTIVAFNPGQSLRPIQTQHHTKFGPIIARLELPAVASICDRCPGDLATSFFCVYIGMHSPRHLGQTISADNGRAER